MECIFQWKIHSTPSLWYPAGVAIIILDKIDFKVKKVTRGNDEGHFIMIKGTISQEDVTLINIQSNYSTHRLQNSSKPVLVAFC